MHFKQHHQIFDVPLCVVADCENYREGNSNAHVASFAYCVVGSNLYTPPPEHRYRVFLDEESDSAVGCMARGGSKLSWKSSGRMLVSFRKHTRLWTTSMRRTSNSRKPATSAA